MYVKLRKLLLLILGQFFCCLYGTFVLLSGRLMPLLWQVLVLFSTFRAFSLDDKGNGVGIESCW